MLLIGCVVIVSIVFAQIFPKGMISYWRADGDPFDSVGQNHGTLYGATYVTGRVGQAFSFDGNDKVIIPHSQSLNTTEAITVEAWLKPNGWTGNYEYPLEKGTWAGNGAWFFFFHRNGGHCNFGIGIPGGIYFKNCGMIGELANGVWSHIVGTYDRQNIKFYVNGELNNQVAWTEPIKLNSHDVYIGSEGSRYYFKGQVDEVAIYNKALTACEIKQHYENGLAGKGYKMYSPADATESLIVNIENLELPKGTEKSFISKLESVLDSLVKGNDKAAINKLQAFKNEVDAQRDKKLTDEQADALVIAVQCIIDNI